MYILRQIIPNDLDAIVKYANNANVARYLTEKFPQPYLKENALAFIDFANNTKQADIKAIVINGEFIGACGIHFKEDVLCKNAELGYWLGEPFWGKGIMRQVIQQRVEEAFNKYAIHRVYASVFSPNEGSKKVLLKSGFQLEATLKQAVYKNNCYYDDCIFSIINPKSFT